MELNFRITTRVKHPWVTTLYRIQQRWVCNITTEWKVYRGV